MLRLGVFCAAPLFLIACDESSDKSSPGGMAPVMEDVTGLVSKGPVNGAAINVYQLNANGTPGTLVAGPIQTASDGSWSVQIEASEPRPLAVVSTGGTYTDEATGATVTAGELNSFLPDGADTVAVTPLTELLVQVARAHLADNPDADIDAGLAAGRETLASVLSVGFDPLIAIPANPANITNATADQLAYAAVLGGLSELANAVAPDAAPFEVIEALVSDMQDGEIDGQSGETPVPVGSGNLTIGGNTLAASIGSFTSENTGFSNVAVYSASFSSVGENGSVSPTSANVLSGGSAAFTLIPATGYSVAEVAGCSGTRQGNTYTTSALSANCEMTVSFALSSYTLNASAGNGGSISPSTIEVNHGSSTSFTLSPNTGYQIASVTGCSGVRDGNTYTTSVIVSACNVTASFSLIQIAVSTSAGANGSISPGSRDVAFGNTTTFTITPNSGYRILNVSGCGGALNGSLFTTAAINAECTVSATFEVLDTEPANAVWNQSKWGEAKWQ